MDGSCGFVGPLISVPCLSNLPYVVHSSNYWVDLNELYMFMKINYQETDKKEIPKRANIRNELTKYEFPTREYQGRTLFALGAIVKYFFHHSRDFSVCSEIVNQILQSLLVKQPTSPSVKQVITHESVFELYTQIAKTSEIDCLAEDYEITLNDNSIPYLQLDYRTCFNDVEWERIKLFEFSFDLIEKERQRQDSSQPFKHITSRKWSYWEDCISSLKLCKATYKLNSTACSYQSKRMRTAAAIEGITITVEGTCHIPELLESSISRTLSEFNIDISDNILALGCNESCLHKPGIHLFLELSNTVNITEMSNIAVVIFSSQKDHLLIQETVFLSKGTIASFQDPTEKYPRFAVRDAYLTKKLGDQILFVYRNTDDDTEVDATDKITVCDICFQEHRNWLTDPLSASKFDRVKEWQIYVPLPVRIFLQRAFVNEESIRRSQDPKSLAVSKICRLLTMYESSLNTLNKLYFGLTQEMNTAELVVNYHNATSVFSITQAAGITRSLNSAELHLKTLAAPERCYYKTYIAKHPLTYETTTDSKPSPHLVSLRDCHIVFLVDNLVRIRTRVDADPGLTKTSQVCTLPITVKGLPRNAKITSDWHEANCDGSDACVCKDAKILTKNDISRCFLSQTEAEKKVSDEFQAESVWGLKTVFNNSKVRKMFETAAQSQEHADNPVYDSALNISFADLSLHEIQTESQITTLEKSFANMSCDDSFSTDKQEYQKTVTTHPTEECISTIVDFDSLVDNYQVYSASHSNAFEQDKVTANSDEADYGNEEGNDSYSDLDSYFVDDSDEEARTESDTEKEETVSVESVREDNEEDFRNVLLEEEGIEIRQSSSTADAFSSDVNEETSVPPTENEITLTDTSSFIRFDVPALLCRHPPPAIGKDDDKSKLREILDDLLIKSGHVILPGKEKEKILIATDHKVASNVFALMKQPRYRFVLPEFPVLHLMKSKITNLISAYKPAGIIQIFKYMKDAEDETDWKKIVTISEIENAVRIIKRLSLALHLSFFIKFLESMDPIVADNILIDLENASLEETRDRWNPAYLTFVKNGAAKNATFCLHLEIMQHCDEIVAIQLAEKTGGLQGYTLLLSVVKSSLPFAFLNGASSYASFCVKLMHEHYRAGPYYQRLKETLFSTPHKDTQSNFALDAQREMDHRDVVKGFRPSSGIKAVIPRMSVIDDLTEMRKANQSVAINDSQLPKVANKGALTYLGKAVTQKDILFATRCTEMMLRIDALNASAENTPKCINEKTPKLLTNSILDSNTFELGQFLVSRFICMSKICGTNEDDCPDIDTVQGPSELRKKIKLGKAVTVNRSRCKASTSKSEMQIIEEKRKRDISKMNKFSLHFTSAMNTCQAIVKPDCSKTETSKSNGMKEALLFALCQKTDQEILKGCTKSAILSHRSTELQQSGLVYLQAKQYPVHAISKGKVLLVEFAGVKFKAFSQSGKQYLDLIETMIYSMLREFPAVEHIVICEEKYTFTPDTFKALTHAKRQKEDKLDIFHLKSNTEMISLESYSRSALTKTKEGKSLSSRFLGEHVHELQIEKDLTLDIDSEYVLSACTCESKECHQEKQCKQFATPVRAKFSKELGFIQRCEITNIRQRKGEAELAQADWLPYVTQELEEDDTLISYVTSGDIDTLPIHLLAVSLHWPRLPNQKFKNDVYLILKKPGKSLKPDVFVVTKIVERLEEEYSCQDIALIVSLSLCIGGNDYLPKFYGISHTDWMAAVLQNETACSRLYKIHRHPVTHSVIEIQLNEEQYLNIVKKIYCPKGVDEQSLSMEEVREISIRHPGKAMRNPQQWMPPISALKKVACLIQSHIQYLLTVCKPESDLPNFLSNGGIRKTSEGDIVYDLGSDVHYTDEKELLKIPEEELREKLLRAKCPRSIKRELPETPSKEKRKSKRKLYTSTPRKIRSLRQETAPEEPNQDSSAD